MRKLILVLAVAIALPFPGAADARVPLSKDPQLEAGLEIVAMGHIVRKYCDRVSLRIFRGFSLMTSLKARGRELGYTDAELKAYFDDKAQKKRVEDRAMAKLEALGATPKQPDSFCSVAGREIEADRSFGHYLTIR